VKKTFIFLKTWSSRSSICLQIMCSAIRIGNSNSLGYFLVVFFIQKMMIKKNKSI